MKKNDKLIGTLCGAFSSICFGFIPLFTLPMMKHGLHSPSILAYRFLFAAIMLFIIAQVRHISLRVTHKQLLILFLLGLIYTCSAWGLQIGYLFLTSGIATVIHFTYPVYVIILMLLIYKQRPHKLTIIAISIAFLGVAFIGGLFGSSEAVSMMGFTIVAMTGLAYASYLVIVNKSVVRNLNSITLSFWALSSSSLAFTCISFFSGGLQPISVPTDWILMLLLALLCTVVANILMVAGVKKVGSTITSVLGALEPLTAVLVGFLVFEEALNATRVIGIALIVFSVLLIALSGRIAYILEVQKLKRRHSKKPKALSDVRNEVK